MADMVNAMTERLLVDAGIASGMHVLDVGSGSGEVSLLLAKLVGEGGHVLGIDQDTRSLTAAQERVRQLALANVTFAPIDLAAPLPELGPFDAVVGRRVLMYLPNPLDSIRRLAATLRPGGVVVFQESDSTMVPACLVSLPLHERVNEWIWRTVEREGANIHIGFELPSILAQAGLIVEHIRAEAVIQGQNTHYPLATVVRAMLPRIIRHGVATESDINIETLEHRLAAEREGANSIYVSDMAFGTWARKPD